MTMDAETLYYSMTKDETIKMIRELKQFMINDYCNCKKCKKKIQNGKIYSCNHECDEIYDL